MSVDSKKIIISRLCWIAGISFIYMARVKYDQQSLHVTFYYISLAFYAFSMAHVPQLFLEPVNFKSAFINKTPLKGVELFLALISRISMLLALVIWIISSLL